MNTIVGYIFFYIENVYKSVDITIAKNLGINGIGITI